MVKVLALLASACVASALDDLQRVRAKVPRDEFRAPTHANDVGKTLNKHLARSHANTKACSAFTTAELQDLQEQLHGLKEDKHNDIYSDVSDTRALRFSSLEEYQAHWSEMNAHAETHPNIAQMHRDGHCLETVMWWTHHISESTRTQLSHLTIPRMPVTAWREPTEEEGESAKVIYDKSYNPSSTCLACHGGGVPWLIPDIEPAPIPRQVNGKDRVRRCDEWYGEDEGECNACEGIAGYYYGDLPDYTVPIECEIVANASEVPLEKRANSRFPKGFAVEMRGADRWPRAAPSKDAACNFTTDCSNYNASMEGKPTPPTVPGHWYAGIHGALYVDHNDGQYGGGMLRHETVYQFPSGPEGAHRMAKGLYGKENMHLTEIHVQTPEMAASSDPGVMLNLAHMNWTNLPSGRMDGDEDHRDWRRFPSPPVSDALCVCVPDPAGLPYFEKAYDNATYKGRVRFIPPWQTTGSYGPPLNKTVVADHWVKWTFHLFVDIETNKPILFSSPYGGVATYGNWTETDELWPKEAGGGWRSLPTRETCFAPSHAPACKDYIPEVTTTSTTAAPSHKKEILMGIFQGMLSDTDNMDTCVLDGISAGGSFNAAIQDIKNHQVLAAFKDLSDALSDIPTAAAECKAVKDDVASLVSSIKGLSPAKAKANFIAHKTDILTAFTEASKSQEAGDFKGMGVQIGMALRRVIKEDVLV